MRFTLKTSYPVGLDISDLSIKLVQLAKQRDKLKIQAVGKTALPPGWLVNGEIKNRKELARAIRRKIARPNFGLVNSREVVACLPESKTFLKIIEVEKGDHSLEEAVRAEIEKHIPLPTEEIYYDWQAIGDNARSQLLLVGAAPRAIVKAQTELLAEAGLTAVALETEPLSVCRALLAEENPRHQGGQNKNYALIDIGATDASLVVYSKNTILFTLSMPISGEDITKKISEALEISREQAEKMKIAYCLEGGKPHSEIKRILDDMIKELIKKSREAIAFFNHHFAPWGPIEKIILCGGGANIQDLEIMLSSELGIETARGNALSNLNENREKLLKPFQDSFGLAADLLKPEAKKEKARGEKILKIAQDASLSYSTAIGLALRGAFLEE